MTGSVTKIERWYDRHTRSWVVQKMDAEGNQIGNAEYVYTKREAILIEQEWMNALNNGLDR